MKASVLFTFVAISICAMGLLQWSTMLLGGADVASLPNQHWYHYLEPNQRL